MRSSVLPKKFLYLNPKFKCSIRPMDQKFSSAYSLSALLQRVKGAVSSSFPYGTIVWVKGEVSSFRIAGGHAYLDLSEHDGPSLVASMRAIIWARDVGRIQSKFLSGTGQSITTGIQIMVGGSVVFSEKFGLSFYISDVEPSFTLGEREALRRRTIERLSDEGYMELQKTRKLSVPPYYLAVVSSEGAAGYEDFMGHLLGNERGFRYQVDFFGATVQGKDAPESIISALRRIYYSPLRYDFVLILRGGGGELDLSCFDDYHMCVAIARTTSPVVTAIGHERDFHVADMVSYHFVKTPTALADYILSFSLAQDDHLTEQQNRLAVAFRNRVSECQTTLQELERRISSSISRAFSSQDSVLSGLSQRISLGAEKRLGAEERRLADAAARIGKGVGRIDVALQAISSLEGRIARGTATLLDRCSLTLENTAKYLRNNIDNKVAFLIQQAESRLTFLEMKIRTTDPRNALLQGNSLVTDSSGVKFNSVEGRSPGDAVSIHLKDGKLDCIVQKVVRTEPLPRQKAMTA